MQGYEETYYKLITCELTCADRYGEGSLYETAINYFIKQWYLWREILDTLEDDELEGDYIDHYLMITNAVLTYHQKMML